MFSDRIIRSLIFLICTLHSLDNIAQNETIDSTASKFTVKGYLKEMPSFTWYDSLFFENLVHNRVNLAWYPNKNFEVHVEFRNRIITGDFVRDIPGYAELVKSNDDYFNLSNNIIENKSMIFNVALDRAFVAWTKNQWEIKAGRQRINWGVNLAWNPNDWFNAYSFFDFDYEERPGSDAVRISYYTDVASSVEVAAKLAEDVDHFVGAGMWKINRGNYDVQFLGGFVQGDLALGLGWAGNIGGAGFKGELTFFEPVTETQVNSRYARMFLGAFSADYSFANSLYLNGSVMYNSNGSNDPVFGFTLINQRVGGFTVRDLSPYLWSSFVQSGYQITPLLFGSLSVMVFPGSNAFFVNPSMSYSIAQNLDINLVGQLFFGDDILGNYGAISKALFVRLKWSF